MDTHCPTEEQLLQWLDASLVSGAREPVARHVESCPSCRALTSALFRLDGPDSTPARAEASPGWAPQPGARVGPWVLLERVGQGAMGEVFAAWDARLDRRVAVKWVRGTGGEAAERRLWEEAQTLARLAHPNVVRVLDAGTHQERTWLAMEWVPGCTLRQFLLARPAWPTTLDLLLQAARGLAEAHRAGVVHRDVKPENVLVDEGELARVSDFGLAARPDGERVVAGTLAYMAPEQLAGEVDARSDQFSFAVVAWEALYGVRPFDADTAEARAAALARPLPRGPLKAPARFRRVLSRALSADPRLRFESMDALIDALTHARERPRRLALGSTLAACVLVTGSALAVLHAQQHGCDGGPDAFRELTTPARLAVLDRYATLAQPFLRDFEARWVDTYGAVCRATRAAHTQSEQRMQQRLTCLEQRRNEVALVLDEATPELEGRALLRALQSVTPPGDCARIEPPEGAHEPVPGEDAQLLARLETAVRLGQFERGEQLVKALEPNRARLRAEGLLANYLMDQSDLLLARNEHVEAVKEGERLAAQALTEAVLERDDEVAFRAALELANSAAADRGDFDEAARRFAEAEAYVARLGASSRHEIELLQRRALVNLNADNVAARQDARRALALAEQESPPSDENLRGSLIIMAAVRYVALEFEDALSLARRALDLSLRMYDADHLETLDARQWVARALTGLGRLDEAAPELEVVLQGQRRQGLDPSTIGVTLIDLSTLESDRGHDARAIELGREAVALLKESGFPLQLALGESNLGRALRLSGQPQLAEKLSRSATERLRALYGPASRELSGPRNELCSTLIELRKLDDAQRCATEALTHDLQNFGEDSLPVVLDHKDLALIRGARGDLSGAVRDLSTARARFAALSGGSNSAWLAGFDRHLAQLELDARHFEAALEAGRRALPITTGRARAHLLHVLARSAAGRHDLAAARTLVDEALALLRDGPADQALRKQLVKLAR